MTYDASDRKSIRRAEKAAALAESNRIAFVKHIMSDPFGRIWMHNLLTQCNVFHTPFVGGSPDVTAFNCGTQNIGLQVFADVVTHCPNEYTLMMQEQSVKEIADARSSTTDNDTTDRTTAATGAFPDPGRDDYRSIDDDNANDIIASLNPDGTVNWPKH